MNPLRHWVFWLVLLLVAALGAQMLMQDPGYVLVRYHGYDYTTTLARAVPWAIGGVLAVSLLWMLVTWPFVALRRRRERQRRALLAEGLDALERGHWAQAEKALLRASEDEEVAGLARIHAARAAASRGDVITANEHLDALPATHAGARAVARAELALSHGRPADALRALDLPDAQPLPPRGLALRAQALAEMGRADEAYGLLGALRQQQAWPEPRLARVEAQWAEASLLGAQEPNLLASRWDGLPKPLRRHPAVAAAYARRASAFGWHDAALRAIEDAQDGDWNDDLATLYGELPATREDARLATLQRWREAHPRSPGVALALARTGRTTAPWPHTERQLREALAYGAGPVAWEELAEGYAAQGDEVRARIAYANALRAQRGDAVYEVPVMAAPGPAPAVEARDANGLPRLNS